VPKGSCGKNDRKSEKKEATARKGGARRGGGGQVARQEKKNPSKSGGTRRGVESATRRFDVGFNRAERKKTREKKRAGLDSESR